MQIRKISITLLAFCAVISGVTAQNTYMGTVTDRKGNPIAGVRVADKSGAFTTTDLYGRYEFTTQGKPGRLSFDLVGFNPRKTGVKPDMNVRMIKSSVFNSPNYGKHFFLGVQVATSETSMRAPTIGINLGVLKNRWGWYLDFLTPAFQNGNVHDGRALPEYVRDGVEYATQSHNGKMENYTLTGERYSYAWHMSTGVMIPFPLISSLYLDAGLRFGEKYVFEEVMEKNYRCVYANRYGFSIELGLSYRISRVMVNVKGGYNINDINSDANCQIPSGPMKKFDSLSFGLSYIF